MDFIEDFLAIKPNEMFHKAEAEVAFKSSSVPYLTLLLMASLFIGVLILMGLFLGGLCQACKSRDDKPKETPVPVTVL